jgi:YD repeat-containing protein
VKARLPKSTTGPGGRVEEAVHDGWGRVVASRTGSGAWTCTTYDARGRTATVVHPGGRTVTTDHRDPLTTTVADTGTATSPAGTLTTRTDLLGRTAAYTDALGTLTTTSYDPVLGLVASVSSTPAGSTARVQAWTYDSAGRVETVAVAGTLVADPAWTPAGELASVAYPGNAASMTVTGRDPGRRVTGQTWTTPAGTHTETRTVSRAARTLTSTYE